MDQNIQQPVSQPLFGQTPQQATTTQVGQGKTLEEELIAHREKWTAEITAMNELMKTIPKVDELLGTIYAKRQEAVDYYHSMNNVILKQMREYKKLSNDMFNNIKVNGYNGLRMPNDTAISRCVETELMDKKAVIDLLTNHNNFIKETKDTIDNLIYGINQKIKVAEMLNGLKF
jgi:hypothetical protein